MAKPASPPRSLTYLPTSSSYSATECYTAASDSRGHSDQRLVRFPPDLLAEAESIVSSRDLPFYRTVHDLIRDGVVHRLAYLSRTKLKDNPELAERVRGLVASIALAQGMAEHRKAEADHVERMKGLDELREAGMVSGRRERVVERLGQFAQVGEDLEEPYRGLYLAQIERVMRELDAG